MYAAIDQIAGRHLSTAAVCTTLDISRSAYYAWRSGGATPRAARDAELAFLLPHDAEEERDDKKRLTKLAKARGKAKREEIEKLFQLPHLWES